MKPAIRVLLVLVVFPALDRPCCAQQSTAPLPGAKPLTIEGDLASEMIDGIDRFLLRELERSAARRESFYDRDVRSPAAYEQSLRPNRERLAHILGVRDERVPFDAPELMATPKRPALVGRGEAIEIYAACWPAFGNVVAEGLLLKPTGREPIAHVVAVPDADQTPEQIAGLVGGVPPEGQFARRLAESGCRVLVPALVSRDRQRRGVEGRRGVELTNREYVYRSAFELGRHVIGYELQMILAGVDWFAAEAGDDDPSIGVIGYGEGGMLALYAAALDTGIDAACVSGYYDSRQNVWREPLDRNVFGLLEQFGDAELAAMIVPRGLVIEACAGPQFEVPPGTGGGPGRLVTPKPETVRREVERARALIEEVDPATPIRLVENGEGAGAFGSETALTAFLEALGSDTAALRSGKPPQAACRFATAQRQQRLIHQLDRHTQALLAESPYVRKKFTDELDTTSLEAYEKSIEPYREYFSDRVIGRFDRELLKANPRTRQVYDTPEYTGYDVVLDVFPDVFAYGVLLLPKNIPPSQRRPVVVCQHGLEGRPQQTIQGDHRAYHDFAARLAKRGFVVFAPQNPYIFGDRFRTLQRKANPLGKTLFSIIVPQHQQIVDWLQTLPQVDPDRIGFYGLSYGGKTAMRVPALVTDYALSICSADFNDWIWKNASTRARYSYVWTGEYEIWEFDLGSTFNHAEMAGLIAPRPFMVERGHFDGVAPDERVAYEYAKVRHLYQAKLGIGERTEIDWFVGPHTINGKGTFEFLHRHLKWPRPN